MANITIKYCFLYLESSSIELITPSHRTRRVGDKDSLDNLARALRQL